MEEGRKKGREGHARGGISTTAQQALRSERQLDSTMAFLHNQSVAGVHNPQEGEEPMRAAESPCEQSFELSASR